MSPQELERYLHEHIPISAAMQVHAAFVGFGIYNALTAPAQLRVLGALPERFQSPALTLLTQSLYQPDLDLMGSMEVGPAESVTLSGTSYDLIPVVQVSDDMVPGSGASPTTQYYQITGDSVLLRAVAIDGSITEVENPTYLTKPLVVGDSWETHPWLDLESAFEASDATTGVTIGSSSVSMKCKMFVVGPESRSVLDIQTETMRVDEVVEALISITCE